MTHFNVVARSVGCQSDEMRSSADMRGKWGYCGFFFFVFKIQSTASLEIKHPFHQSFFCCCCFCLFFFLPGINCSWVETAEVKVFLFFPLFFLMQRHNELSV